MQTTITLNPEIGNLPQWAEQEATRLSQLRTFQPKGWNAVGNSRACRKLNAQLRAVGFTGSFRDTIVQDICDLARLKAAAGAK